MRGSIVIEKILEILQGGAEASVGIMDAMLSGSGRKLDKSKLRHFDVNWAEMFRDRQKFYSLLGYLKKQGLVESKKENKKSLWEITKKGLEKLKVLKERNYYSKENAIYPKSSEEATFKIIAYDIPARENNKKRLWLRWALHNIGFAMLQKSVWVGKNKIPEEFVRDLSERKLLTYVQILEVAKQGTLKEII